MIAPICAFKKKTWSETAKHPSCGSQMFYQSAHPYMHWCANWRRSSCQHRFSLCLGDTHCTWLSRKGLIAPSKAHRLLSVVMPTTVKTPFLRSLITAHPQIISVIGASLSGFIVPLFPLENVQKRNQWERGEMRNWRSLKELVQIHKKEIWSDQMRSCKILLLSSPSGT